MIDDDIVLGGRKSNPDLDGTRLLTLCSNRVVSVSASSSFILSVRLYDRLFRFLKISVCAAVCSAPIIITHLEALCVLWYGMDVICPFFLKSYMIFSYKMIMNITMYSEIVHLRW